MFQIRGKVTSSILKKVPGLIDAKGGSTLQKKWCYGVEREESEGEVQICKEWVATTTTKRVGKGRVRTRRVRRA